MAKGFTFEEVNDTLNDRQKLFCMLYVGECKFNGTESAKKAGYSENTAMEQASRLLTNVKVSEFIESLKKDLGLRIGVTAEMIANEYKKIAFSNIADVLTVDNGVSSVKGMEQDVSVTIKKIKVKQMQAIEGETMGEIVEIEMHDKLGSLDKLAKMIGVEGVTKSEVKINKIGIDDENYI